MGRLTTHVIDTARGCPAAGLALRLDRLTETGPRTLGRHITNADGRIDQPLLEGDALLVGDYELTFHAGAYFDEQQVACANGRFLADVPVRFHVADGAAHYHVPLLLSPYGYSTYRGS